MKRITISLSFFLIINHYLFAQPYSFEWVDGFGGLTGDAAYGLAVDLHGNTYTTGFFQDTVDFDPGPGTHYLYPGGGFDSYILKLDSAKNLIWARQVAGPLHSRGMNITIDEHLNVYTIGTFSGTADFDPGVGVYNLTNSSGTAMYISKLDSLGNFVWAKAFIGFGVYVDAFGVYVDHDGNVFTSGKTSGTVDFDPGPSTYNLPGTPHSAFISKLDSSGNFVWVKQVGDDAALIYSIEEDADNNLYMAGFFRETNDFDPGPGVYTLTGIDLYPVAFFLKLDPNGNFMHAFQVGSGVDQNWGRVVKQDNTGNILFAGPFEEAGDFDPGPGIFMMTPSSVRDGFICKYDTAFNFIWGKQLTGGYLTIYSMVVDAADNIYISGELMDTVDFDPGPGIFNLISAGEEDAFVARYDASGNFVWAGRMGGTNHWDRAFAIGLDGNGNIYSCGTFNDTIDFDPDTTTVVELHSLGNPTLWSDNFILKLSHCLVPNSSLFQTACDSFSLNGFTYYSSGNYNQSLMSIDGCDSSITLHLTIHTVDNSVIQSGITLTANASPATYQWVNCDLSFAIIPGETGSSFTTTSNGNYAVIIDQTGCIDTSGCYLVNTAGITGKNNNDFKIFPNPASDILYISSTENQSNVFIKIFDLSGRLINTFKQTDTNLLGIPVDAISPGTYILELTSDKEILRERFIKN